MSSGRFVWRELTTPDTARSASFYAELFGWTSKAMNPAEPAGYQVFEHGGEQVGGFTPPMMPEAPSMWLDYVTVDDVDASLARVIALGGRAYSPAMDVPGTGRFAVVASPDGAVFALFRGTNPGATDTERQPPVGTFCWSQLFTQDLPGAVAFYTEIFGWTAEEMGGMVVFKTGTVARASASKAPEGVPTAWLAYVAVDDVDASAARGAVAGATIMGQPADIPGMGRFAVLIDPTGAPIALWKNV
jgi:predicted enzyme related to lactoylglutathione lyase